MRAMNHIHAVDDDFTTGLQNFIHLAHDIASTSVDHGVEQCGPTLFLEQLGEAMWPIL